MQVGLTGMRHSTDFSRTAAERGRFTEHSVDLREMLQLLQVPCRWALRPSAVARAPCFWSLLRSFASVQYRLDCAMSSVQLLNTSSWRALGHWNRSLEFKESDAGRRQKGRRLEPMIPSQRQALNSSFLAWAQACKY